MGEPREIVLGPERYQVDENGTVSRRLRYTSDALWQECPARETRTLREVARLQEENRRLREEGIRDTMHILFNECRWLYGYRDDAMVLYYPPGFVLPEHEGDEEQTISRTAMADALADALLRLVP